MDKFGRSWVVYSIAGILLVTTIGVGGYHLLFSDDFTQYPPHADHTASYTNETEQLRIEISKSGYNNPEGSSKTALVRVLWINDSGTETQREPVTIRGKNSTSSRGIWYAVNGSGVSPNKLKSGDSVVVLSDPTDRDEDGRYGPEAGDRFWITARTNGGAQTRVGVVVVSESGVCVDNQKGGWDDC